MRLYEYQLGYYRADAIVLEWVTRWNHSPELGFFRGAVLREGWCAVAMRMQHHWVPRVVRIENLKRKG